jgi:putative zinc finger protein
MRCSRVEQLLPAYLDGDLPDHLYQRVSNHVDQCGRCRTQEAAQHRAMRALDMGRHPLAIDLWADFSRRLDAEARPQPRWWPQLWQPGLATAVAAIVVALVARTAPSLSPVTTAPSLGPQMAQLPVPQATSRGSIAVEKSVVHASRSQQGAAAVQPSGAAPAKLHPQKAVVTAHPGQREKPATIVIASARHDDAIGLAKLQQRSHHPAKRPGEPIPARPDAKLVEPPPAADPAQPTHPLTVAAVPPAGDPLDVAAALVVAQQDAASEQMQGELLLLAREVTRVGGEAGSSGSSHDATGT